MDRTPLSPASFQRYADVNHTHLRLLFIVSAVVLGFAYSQKGSHRRFGVDQSTEECNLQPHKDAFQTIVLRLHSVLGSNVVRRLFMEAVLIHWLLSHSLFNTHRDV